jgi:hypothetical protein
MLYMATSTDLPLRTSPEITIEEVESSREAVLQSFRLPVVRFIGAHTGCSCGFPSVRAETPVDYFEGGFRDAQHRELDLQSVRALLNLIREHVLDSGEIANRRTLQRCAAFEVVASVKETIRRRLRPGNHAPWEEVVGDLNRAVQGWRPTSYGSVTKARHAVKLHLYHTVRWFLRHRHNVAGPGYRQFPAQDVFGKLGALSPDSCPRVVRSSPPMP